MKTDGTSMDKIVNLAKRRGFVFPSAEIYGGLGGFWDWGPLGVLLKNNVKTEWWKTFVQQRGDVVGIDGAVVTKSEVLQASGHTEYFVDFVIECKSCHVRSKAEDVLPPNVQEKITDHLVLTQQQVDRGEVTREAATQQNTTYFQSLVPYLDSKVACPNCGSRGWAAPSFFNTMFKTGVGPASSSSIVSFLRPETAQSIFVNYENVREATRMRLPFGIAQIGKAFRNEVTPGNFIFRSREFEQMEIEYFVKPGDDDAQFEVWVQACYQWFISLGLKRDHLRLFPQPKAELAHYSKATTDIEYAFPIGKGWAELMGIANRTDYDLRQHGQAAKGHPEAFATSVDETAQEKKVPFVIEPSMGVDRAVLAFLLDAYEVVKGGRTTTTESIKEEEVVLKLHPRLAPYKAAILPLSKKPELQKIAREIAATLRQEWMVDYDETGSIGKRYRRQDEIGTPFCVTVDFDTLEGTKRPKGTVTVRDRDTMKQEDVAIPELSTYLQQKLA